MNFLFSLFLLSLIFPKGHQFEQGIHEDNVENLSIEGTDGTDLEKVYAGLYYEPTEPKTDSQNVENTHPSPSTDENSGNSEFIPTTAPATALEVSEENLSSDNSEILRNEKEYSMFSEHGKDAKAVSNFDSSEGEFDDKPKSAEVLKKNTVLAVAGKESKEGRNERDNERGSVLSEKLKIDATQMLGEGDEKHQFLSKNKAKSGKAVIAARNEQNVNLEEKTTAKPPYVLKHKMNKEKKQKELDDLYFLFIVIGCSVAGIAGLALAGYCWYKLHTTAKAVSEAEYPGSYGATAKKQPIHAMQSGDHKLDYNAEMYHYQHTKNQLAAMEKAGGSRVSKGENLEDDENSDEGDEGDYTVYECPGLAPTGDMTVVNPMFSDQEQVTSDQDANGVHSGKSAEGSPTFPRQTPKE